MKHVRCNPGVQLGKIRPQHGVCNWPQPMKCYEYGPDVPIWKQILKVFEEIDVPVTRVKYYHSQCGKELDVPYIFADYRKDPTDPENYYFYMTDDTMTRIAGAGKPIVYRLGAIRETWSPFFTIKPKDYDHFAEVCLHIVRHLNDGWANGLHCGIQYWEIWNRADEIYSWYGGTAEDYYRLYETVARKIKAAYPELKVGGPAAADCSDLTFLQGFVDYVKAKDVPCDFVSWNYYGLDAAEAGRQGRAVKKLVADAGLNAEVINDEWNAITLNERGVVECYDARNAKGAAFDAAFMMQMEEAGMDFCTYYDASHGTPWGALYQTAGYLPHKPLFAVQAFARLYRRENRIGVKTVGKNIYAMAAEKEGKGAILVAVCEDKRNAVQIEVPFTGKKRVSLVDETHDLEVILETEDVELTIPVRGHSIILVESI